MQKWVWPRKLWVIVVLSVLLCLALWIFHDRQDNAVIKIGVLHSLSGTMAVSEKPLVDALQFAVDEVNASGGINGRQIVAVVEDCRSEAAYCAQLAERMITQDRVSALFGCWTSACRKAVKTVVEKHRHLLFYPLQYEGMEQSHHIIYTGAAPNQQIIPGVLWALQHLGKRAYLLGSDYVFPRMANILAKDILAANGGNVIGERYVPLGHSAMAAVVADIQKKQPDVVLNTLNGDSNFAFFTALKEAGISAQRIPVMSFSMAEVEVAAMPPQLAVGHYAVWNYFQSLTSERNRSFISRFRARFNAQGVLDDPMEASCVGLHLWAQAAREAGSAEPARVQQTILRQTMLAPEGMVAVDAETRHLWKTPRVGRIAGNGQFEEVWSGMQPLQPAPFPDYHFREEWLKLLKGAEGGGQ